MNEPKASALRLDYLDGVRACAAMYVVLFHAGPCFSCLELKGAERVLCRALAFGHEAVAVFIVLSGYCLMLPVARARDERMSRRTTEFLARRAYRILPPYYATLGLSLLLLATVPVLQQPGTGTIWDDSLPGLEWGPVVSHLLLMHNWFDDWVFQINGPLWSVATEWQIYFFFPLFLLPLWQRLGVVATLGLSFALGYLPLWLGAPAAREACPWYLGLFAMGMVAATIGFSKRDTERRLRALPWGAIAVVAVVGCLVGGLAFAGLWFSYKPVTDVLVGLATAGTLVHLTQRAERSGLERGLLLRALESRPLLAVGHFSYSLYLTHLPVVALCYFALARLGLAPLPFALSLLVVSFVASLAVGYVFFLAVERHFLHLRAPAPRAVGRPEVS